jgi:hypothetical protein
MNSFATISVTILPRESGRFVARASTTKLDAIAYGATEHEATAAALEALAQNLKHYRDTPDPLEEARRLLRGERSPEPQSALMESMWG